MKKAETFEEVLDLAFTQRDERILLWVQCGSKRSINQHSRSQHVEVGSSSAKGHYQAGKAIDSVENPEAIEERGGSNEMSRGQHIH